MVSKVQVALIACLRESYLTIGVDGGWIRLSTRRFKGVERLNDVRKYDKRSRPAISTSDFDK